MDNITTLLAVQVQKKAQAVAVIDADRILTYAQLDSLTNQMAHYLKDQGVQQESLVALSLERSAEVLLWMVAILKAGGAYVPLDSKHPADRLLLILNENNIPFLITSPELKAVLNLYEGQVICDPPYLNYAAYPLENISLPAHLAYIIFTSGSTGKPKGVLIERGSVVNYTHLFSEFCLSTSIERVDFSANYAFDMAVTSTIVALMCGITIVVARQDIKLNADAYLRFIRDQKINLIKITPSYFQVLLHAVKSTWIDLPDLKTIVLGGEKLATLDCVSWQSYYPKHVLINEYGPTESTVAVSFYQFSNVNEFSTRPEVPIGIPGHGVRFYLLDENSNAVNPGELGELYIGGSCLARGYLNQEALTKRCFIEREERLYKTGDLCRQLSLDVYEYIGRSDFQVKIRGYRIELGEIEYHLSRYPGIKQVVVTLQRNYLNAAYLSAYYLSDLELTSEELKKYLRLHLIEAMIPSIFIKLAQFPLNENGKLDRKALPIIPPIQQAHYRPPENDLQKIICECWLQELELEQIGIEDNFFQLGGHSLIAARIITQLRHRLKKEIEVEHLQSAPTILQLAESIEKLENSKQMRQMEKKEGVFHLGDFQLLIWLANLFEKKVKKLNVVFCKRFRGPLHVGSLERALNILVEKYPILSSKIHSYRPIQSWVKVLPPLLIIKDLKWHSLDAQQHELMDSVQDLQSYNWKEKDALIAVHVFYLKNNEFEIHVALPHIISDGFTGDLVFAQLACVYNTLSSSPLRRETQFYDYILSEKAKLEENIEEKVCFWKKYFADTQLIYFSQEKIPDQVEHFKYSSYFPLSKTVMQALTRLAQDHQNNLNAVIAAAVSYVLFKQCTQNNLFINLVKSTRNNGSYDESMGCFLRLEPIKVQREQAMSLASLIQQVKLSIEETAPYQASSSCLKLAAPCHFSQLKKFRYYLVRMGLAAYARLFSRFYLHPKTIEAYARLAAFKQGKAYLININLWGSFFQQKSKFTFSLKNAQETQHPHYNEELITINQVLDICFLRDEFNQPFLVVSGYLKPEFREKIATELIQAITNAVTAVDIIE